MSQVALPNFTDTTPSTPNMDSDTDLQSFVSRFRTLVSQITRETEEALEFAQSDDEEEGSSRLSEDIYTSLPPRPLGYDEFGQPYRPDEPIRILNTFVRRMPTIESMGSREMATSISSASSSMYTRETHGRPSINLSRPPTRANTLRSMTDHSGSEGGPSRSNSISGVAATLIGETNELGQLVDRIAEQVVLADQALTRRTGSSGSRTTGGTTGTGGSSNMTRSMHSYYTAGSHSPSSPLSEIFGSSSVLHSEPGHYSRPSSIKGRSRSPSLDGDALP